MRKRTKSYDVMTWKAICLKVTTTTTSIF